MNNGESKTAKEALAGSSIHEKWVKDYRSGGNKVFYTLAFESVLKHLHSGKGALTLDAGCGSCVKSIILAGMGFNIVAADFSKSVLDMAEKNVIEAGLRNKIRVQQEDLTAMSFKDGTFDNVLCWGVLMHIPDVEKALSELVRVLKPGGTIVISEGNVRSLQSIALRSLKALFGKKRAEVKMTERGLETWEKTETGSLMTRQSKIPWLISHMEGLNCRLVRRQSGQFTELYTVFRSGPANSMIHAFNNFWFKRVTLPHPAYGNLIIMKKAGK